MSTELIQLVRFARNHSPFYRELYKGLDLDLPVNQLTCKALPVVDHASYWLSNSLLDSRVITAPQTDGIILRTGGM